VGSGWFSPLIDIDWGMGTTLLGGVGLLVLAFGWSTLKFRQYGAA
jgi:hypothetical protein